MPKKSVSKRINIRQKFQGGNKIKKIGAIIVIVIVFLLVIAFGIVCNKKDNTSGSEFISITESIRETQSVSEMQSESNTIPVTMEENT